MVFMYRDMGHTFHEYILCIFRSYALTLKFALGDISANV